MRTKLVLAFILWGVVSATGLSACRGKAGPPVPVASPAPARGSFIPVRDLLTASCALARCHNSESRAALLDLSVEKSWASVVNVKSAQVPLERLVTPGEPQHSYLLAKVRGEKTIRGARMPIGHTYLTAEQEQMIEEWISAGAAK